jgi:polysaccharide deacetylase family protein (PEP-CTERM system associated)
VTALSSTGNGEARAALSIDVEDWFHVENLTRVIARASWPERELRVVRNTDRLLEILDERSVRATCFVLGWVAERRPELIRRIADAGHEVACHGYDHELLGKLSVNEFRQDVRRAKTLLEDITGAKVRGYRAPSFSVTDWAIPVLEELGFTYDSSFFPVAVHDRYGWLTGVDPSATITELRPGFHEVAISCLALRRRRVPWGGGGYFRLIPYPVFRAGIKRILASGQPYVFYMHPWEIDPEQPRVNGLSRTARLRHYTGLKSAEGRVRSLVRDLHWTTVADLLAAPTVHGPSTLARRASTSSELTV